MKKIVLLIALFPILLWGQNIVVNPGFEDDPFDNGWVKVGATFSDTSEVHSGDHACVVVASDKNKGIKMKNYITDGNGLYLLSAWVKADAGMELKIQSTVEATAGNQTMNAKYITTGQWQHIGVSFGCQAGEQYKSMILTSQDAGTFLIDDIEIIKIDGVQNGDFEAGIGTYWSAITLKNGAVASVSEADDNGNKALKVDIETSGTPGAVGDVLVNSFSLIPFNNSPILVSFKAKATLDDANAVATAGFGSGYKNIYGKHLAGDNNYGGVFNLTEDYRTYKWVLNTIDYTKWFYANVSLRFGPATGEYFLDDFMVGTYAGAPTINSTPILNADTTSDYSYQVTVEGEMVGKWGLSRPSGLSLSIDQYTGLISGKPDTVGVFDLVAYLQTGVDSVGQAFTLTVTEGSTTLESVKQQSLDVYPSVTDSWIKVEGLTTGSIVDFYALSGQKVKSLINENNSFDLSSFKNGMYIMRAEGKQTMILKR